MCIGVHGTVSFKNQSAKAAKSRHLILVTKANIWRATVIAKWVTIGNYLAERFYRYLFSPRNNSALSEAMLKDKI